MKIAVVGGYGVALTMRVERAPAAGETVSGGILSSGPGGKGSNQAIAAARLGQDVSLFTAIGQDSAGEDGRSLWLHEGVDAAAVHRSQTPTMTGFITVDAAGENRISIAPGALAHLVPDDLRDFEQHITASDVLLVSLEIPVALAARALQVARASGTVTVLNPAPATELGHELWQEVDFVTPNLTEAAVLAGALPEEAGNPRALVERLQRRTGAVVVMTMGESGVVVHDGKGIQAFAAAPVHRVVDTAGAGDAFTAAFGVATAEGRPLGDAVRFACAAGAHAVTIAEVVPSLATRSELREEFPGLVGGDAAYA